MRILFLSPEVPYPVLRGGRQRIESLIRALARFATVHVLAAGDASSAESSESAHRLSELGVALEVFQPTGPGSGDDPKDESRLPDALGHFHCPGLREALPAVLDELRPDVVHVEELVMAQYADALPSPCTLSRQKVEWDYLAALAGLGDVATEHDRREAARFRSWEESLAGRFDRVLVVGEGDRRLLEPLHGAERLQVVPLAVGDLLRPPPDRPKGLDFVLLYGVLDYPPNVEANAAYFRDVWPPLRRALPELKTVVVGSGRVPASLRSEDPRVEIQGFVPEIAPLLCGAGALAVPLHVGGGARTKILEALACGMPVVSTSVGVENLELEPGRHYLPAETPADLVDAVVRLAEEPELYARLGHEGAVYVDQVHRQARLSGLLEPVYRSVVDAGTPSIPREAARSRALLVGVAPLPEDGAALGLSFAGHRTAQFRTALLAAGHEVHSVLLDEEGSAEAPHGARLLSPESFGGGRELQRVHDFVRPDIVVAAGGYHPARAAVQLATVRPRWIDLPGDLAAEGQLRAAAASDRVYDHLGTLCRALEVGDSFSVVGPSQRLALLGQLGLSGRLPGDRLGEEPVAILPVAAEGPERPPPLPEGNLTVLWNGGYNTWMDWETLLAGLERAMRESPDLRFVSTGGSIAGHDEQTHERFWSAAHASAFAGRFEDRGRLSRREALDVLRASHVVLCISRPCLEAELGSRQRLVEATAYGRPAVATALGDAAAEIAAADAGLAVPPRDPEALAKCLLRFAGDRGCLEASARRARRLWEQRWTYAATTEPLCRWAGRPVRWPPSQLERSGLARLAEDRLHLQAELGQIRGSYTFRALRLLDRLLGRGRGGA